MKLLLRPQDDLNWQIVETPEEFFLELGLNAPYFPLEDELHFQSLGLGLSHFGKEVWPKHMVRGVIYQGSADFNRHFSWTEKQLANFEEWQSTKAPHDLAHLQRLFTAEAFIAYFQMLAHKLPDEMELVIRLDASNTGSLAQTLHLLSPERFEHFRLEWDAPKASALGVCFPPDSLCSSEILKHIDEILAQGSVKAVYEPLLTEQWDGLDELIVFPEALSPQGRRKLAGFEAAGGVVREFRGRGI